MSWSENLGAGGLEAGLDERMGIGNRNGAGNPFPGADSTIFLYIVLGGFDNKTSIDKSFIGVVILR